MSIELPADLRQFVEHELASGRYGSADELYRDAVDILRRWRHRQLQQDIALGLEQLDRGMGIECDDDVALRAFFDDVISEGRRALGARSTLGS